MNLHIAIRKTLGTLTLQFDRHFTGDLVAVIGPSGAGKSTLLHILAGILAPDTGTITLDQDTLYDHATRTNTSAQHRRVGLVFQDDKLFPHLSVERNLFFAPNARPGGDWTQRILDTLELHPILHRAPRDLSGGERKRVALGRALLAMPRLLLLDEPWAGLDAVRRRQVTRLIERVRDHVTIPMIIVSHRERDICRLADDILHLVDGRPAPAVPAIPRSLADPAAPGVVVRWHNPNFAVPRKPCNWTTK